MESSPAATMAPPPVSSSKSRDPLLFGSFALPAGWGCRRPMAFCRDIDAHVVSEPAPNAAAAVAAEPVQNKGSRSPAKGATAEEAPEAPRRQWNLRDRTSWRDYRVEDARPLKKLGNTEAGGTKNRGFSVPLTRQEIDADFFAITGRKPPRKPKKRPKGVQRQIETLYPGSSLAEVTRDRYKVNEVRARRLPLCQTIVLADLDAPNELTAFLNAVYPQNLLSSYLCLSLAPSLAASSVADSARRAASYGGDGGSAGEAARRSAAPPRAVGASAARGRPPHARPPRRVPARTRSPQAVVPPAGRRGPGRRRGDVRRRDRGAAGQAHGPPARRGRPATRAPLAASSAEEDRESAAGDGLRARARAPGAASAPASAPTASSSKPAAGDARGRRHHEAVEPAGAHASAARRQVVGRVGDALLVAVSEAAQARPVLRVADGGGDRGGHLRADRRQAAAAAEEAAARRTAAARYAVPRAVAHRDHRRRVPSAGRVAAPAPACRRRQLSSKPSDSNHLNSLVGRLIASQSRLLSAHRAGRALVNWSAAPPAPSFSARRMV